MQSHGSNNSATDRERANLHRRFTTNTVPTLNSLAANTPLSPIGQQRRQAAESADVNPAVRDLPLSENTMVSPYAVLLCYDTSRISDELHVQ